MTESHKPNRRQAIKYLIAGAAASACPIPEEVLARGDWTQGAGAPVHAQLESEINTICHKVRDGAQFALPKPSAEHEVVIVGGGPSGLMAAYRLRSQDVLLLEKEPRLGGDALSEEWQGEWYSTGSAYADGEALEALCREIGMEIYRIKSVDAAIINGRLVPSFWEGGFRESPYPESVKKSFAKFQADMKGIDTEKSAEKLDSMTFAEILSPYAPEVKLWFDNFGPNNWGADTENTSALVGVESAQWGGGLSSRRYTWPGGLGRISAALEAAINKAGSGRIRKNATVVSVENAGSGVLVSYFHDQELITVRARAAIIACPKHIGKHIIKGLPTEQFQAMNAMRYAPYLVINACARQVIYNGSYDTDIPAPSPIVDFNVAGWVVERDSKETKRRQVLTCYVPRPEADRVQILDDAYVLGFGQKVVELLNTWFPGAREKIEEVHIYRRGHPLFMSAPGVTTRLAPKIRQPFGNVFMAHSDSEGDVSTYESAQQAANRTAAQVMQALKKRAAGRVPDGAGRQTA
ncbi:MAG TPA: FAD-dependent oxidoreductase [Terriglobia bacterium]|nr:FAD-dependent oxidoreductase [Terriglobia bacterium]